MGPLFSVMILVALGACLFVPIFVIALVMKVPALGALLLSATFSLGAVLAGLATMVLVGVAVGHGQGAEWRNVYGTAFVAAGAVAGGVIALWLLNKFSDAPPWRRD